MLKKKYSMHKLRHTWLIYHVPVQAKIEKQKMSSLLCMWMQCLNGSTFDIQYFKFVCLYRSSLLLLHLQNSLLKIQILLCNVCVLSRTQFSRMYIQCTAAKSSVQWSLSVTLKYANHALICFSFPSWRGGSPFFKTRRDNTRSLSFQQSFCSTLICCTEHYLHQWFTLQNNTN